MTKEEIIASGLLELYVTGSLSQDEILEVETAITQYPELLNEVEGIEEVLIRLSENTKQPSKQVWNEISETIDGVKPISAKTPNKKNLSTIIGWAAAIICGIGLLWTLNENKGLTEELNSVTVSNTELEEKLNKQEIRVSEVSSILEIVRSKEYVSISLPGNKNVAPEAFAAVYYNADENIAYIDAQGLPQPPDGKVYQAWSLTLNPLTPTSMGTLDGFKDNERKFFKIENVPTPEAFGITLEPAGGSVNPTLEQLYTLGTVNP